MYAKIKDGKFVNFTHGTLDDYLSVDSLTYLPELNGGWDGVTAINIDIPDADKDKVKHDDMKKTRGDFICTLGKKLIFDFDKLKWEVSICVSPRNLAPENWANTIGGNIRVFTDLPNGELWSEANSKLKNSRVPTVLPSSTDFFMVIRSEPEPNHFLTGAECISFVTGIFEPVEFWSLNNITFNRGEAEAYVSDTGGMILSQTTDAHGNIEPIYFEVVDKNEFVLCSSDDLQSAIRYLIGNEKKYAGGLYLSLSFPSSIKKQQ